MKKKLVVFFACLTTMTMIFASGVKEKGNDSPANGSSSSVQPVTIRMVHYMGEQAKRDALDAMIKIYEKDHPNVKVDIETVASSSYLATYKNYIAAGDAPDIMFGKPQNMTEFAEAGFFMDLTSAECEKNVLPMLKDECTVSGKLYGFPIDTQIKSVFYNKKMFREAGLNVPATKDDFFKVCDTFKSKGIYPMVHPYNFIHGVFHELDAYFTPMAYATDNGNVWLNSQKGKTPLSGNPMVKEAFDEFSRLVSYKAPGDSAVDQAQGIQDFAAGKRPMYINGGWMMGDTLAASPNGEFGMFPMPWSNNPDQNKLWVGIDDVFIVSSSTMHKKEVLELLNSFAGAESSTIWMNTAKLMSSNTTVSTDSANQLIKEIKKCIDQDKIVSKSNVPDYTSEYSTAFRTKLQYFVTFDDAHRNVDKLLTDIDKEITSIRK